MQRVKWLFYPLLFVLLFSSSLHAISFKDIVFDAAIAEFVVDKEEEIQESFSNLVHINVKINEEQNLSIPTLSFYRYDTSSDNYLTVSQTNFSPNEALIGEFNPMTPLLLEDGQEIDISKKIPAIKCLVFRRDEPLIIVYHDENIKDKKCIDLYITTDKDKEVVRLQHSDENSTLFVGYINTTTTYLKRCDGKLFVEKGSQITASLGAQGESKSRSFSPTLFAVASVESSLLEIKSTEEKREADIWVGVEASKDVSSIGEFLKYTCVIENRGGEDVKDANFNNKLSQGLIYRQGTFRFDDKKIEKIVFSKDKKEITYAFDIKAGESKTFTFVAQVDINAQKNIQNRAFVAYNNRQSPFSTASTKIKKDFDDKSVIMGKVTLNSHDENLSLAGIRFYLENGTYIHSDKRGKFHFEDVEPGSHVVSIDTDSIAGRFVLTECQSNARNMGSKTSYFVDTATAHIKEVRFCLQEDKEIKALKPTLSFNMSDMKLEKMPDFTEEAFENESKKNLFLWPRENFVPPMPSIKVAFLHQVDEKIVLYLNGEKVDMLNFDGFVKSSDKKRMISKYRGVDILNGDNFLEAQVLGAEGKVLKRIKRKIHLSTSPVKAKVLREKSSLMADGKTSPVIAVQLFDASGYPLRSGVVGTFSLQKPYLSQERLDALKDNPLSQNNSDDKYTVSQNGIAYIALQPTTTSGEVKLHFPFQNSNEYSKVWLNSEAREWFVVGFAEGSVGYKTLETHLISSAESSLYHDEKISFFAKGKVGADALLSIAYDSGKREDLGILEELNPVSEYTVYADESFQHNEAPSSKKLYVKIEKKSFYALFGDFDTGMDTHAFSRYSRRVNGIKSELKAETFEYKAFISQSDTSFSRQEIQGDGTSGLYHLKLKDIMIGSEKITLEVRDRYRDEVIISRKVLNPILDYNIDYLAGTLYFKEPILSKDGTGNPQFIIIESEVDKGGKKRLSFGGRGAVKFFSEQLEVGVSVLAQEQANEEMDTLYGFDARVQASENIIINAEYAQSKKSQEDNNSIAKAYLIEVSHHDSYIESKLYYKVQEEFFGFGQQNLSQSGTKKYGLDSTINYWQNIAINLALYGDELLETGKTKSVAEAFLQYQKADLTGSFGYRYGKSGDERASSQLVGTISKRFFQNKVKLAGAYEHTLGDKSDIFQNRAFAEAAYFINQYVEIFANHEILEGATIKTNQSRLGIKGQPWSGGTIQSAVSNKFEDDSTRLFGLLGVNQNWQVTKRFTVNASVEKEQTIEGKREDFTAYAMSANYRKDKWIYNAKVEYRTSKLEDKTNIDFGFYTKINDDLGMAFGMRNHLTREEEGSSQSSDAKLSFAYRPEENFLVMNRLSYLYERDENSEVSKAVNSFLCVVNPSEKSTISGHYGLKYTQDSIDGENYSSWIDTIGLEYIYNISKKIELGFQGSLLHAYNSESMHQSIGGYLGYNLFKNTYVGLGYNFEGYHDSDFDGLRRSEQGVFLKFRVKFDQESLQDVLSIF